MVDGFGIEDLLSFDGEAAGFREDSTEEARAIAFVAGGPTDLADFQQQCITIAVEPCGQ